MNRESICKYDDCYNTVYARGYCTKHYRKLNYHGIFDKRSCIVTGCVRYASHKNGLCGAHYQRLVRLGTVGDAEIKIKRRTLWRYDQNAACMASGCGRPVSTHGYCATHARNRHRGYKIKPINEKLSATVHYQQGQKIVKIARWGNTLHIYNKQHTIDMRIVMPKSIKKLLGRRKKCFMLIRVIGEGRIDYVSEVSEQEGW